MTSNKNPTPTQTPPPSSAFRLVVCAVLGVGLAAYGVRHGVESYPSPDAFARFSAALPAVESVASFALGLAAILVGLVLLVPALYRLRRRRRQRPASGVPRGAYGNGAAQAARPAPSRRGGEGDCGDYGYDPDECDPDGYGYGYGYGGEDHPAGAGQRHGGGYGVRPRDDGDYDGRRRTGSRR